MAKQSELGDYIGEIRPFASNRIPPGWSTCEGQELNIKDYHDLFNIIGTVFGGDGSETFCLPDLRASFPTQANNVDTATRGGNYAFAQSGGSNIIEINENNLPAHNHKISISTPDNPPKNIIGNPTARIVLHGNDQEGTSPFPNASTGEINLGMVQDIDHNNNPGLYNTGPPYPIFEGATLGGISKLLVDTNAVTLSPNFFGQSTGMKVDFPNYLAINYIICINGIVPPIAGPDSRPSDLQDTMQGYTGEIRLFAGQKIPSGWLSCEGQTMSINTNQVLYSILGYSFTKLTGAFFNLPDLRGVFPTGYFGSGESNHSGVYTFGQSGGVDSIEILPSHLPEHNHQVQVLHGGGISGQINFNASILANDQPGVYSHGDGTYMGTPANVDGVGIPGLFNNAPASIEINVGEITVVTENNFSFNPEKLKVEDAYSGDKKSSKVKFVPKFLALNYIICVRGLYPNRNQEM